MSKDAGKASGSILTDEQMDIFLTEVLPDAYMEAAAAKKKVGSDMDTMAAIAMMIAAKHVRQMKPSKKTGRPKHSDHLTKLKDYKNLCRVAQHMHQVGCGPAKAKADANIIDPKKRGQTGFQGARISKDTFRDSMRREKSNWEKLKKHSGLPEALLKATALSLSKEKRG